MSSDASKVNQVYLPEYTPHEEDSGILLTWLGQPFESGSRPYAGSRNGKLQGFRCGLWFLGLSVGVGIVHRDFVLI